MLKGNNFGVLQKIYGEVFGRVFKANGGDTRIQHFLKCDMGKFRQNINFT